MASVDNRVVSISFDNASFEKNIESTLKSLEKLKSGLDFKGAKGGFDEISAASKGLNFDSMGSALEGVSAKFVALSTIAITVLANIANRAVDAGIKLVKSLSFDQIKSGFQEYETNMNSIQTILANTASKGSTLKDVGGALDELNHYADQTIYNFSEMTRNIGTFTAAGIDLDTSVQGIKGIANLAAISGSNSQQASTAMYQLSQALASGTVKLMDWNSVVNAGMGGEVFQKALFESGKAMKTLNDVPMTQTFEEWKDAGNTFRGSLESGWITAEVLTNTLSGFTGDLTEAQILSMGYTQDQAAEIMRMGQIGKDAATKVKTLTQLVDTVKEAVGSGWSESFKIIIGDFEEAKELFSGISEAIGGFVGKNAEARNALLQNWKDLGGRTRLIEAGKAAFVALGSVLTPIKEAFRDIFPPITAENLYMITRAVRTFMENLKISASNGRLLKETFRGVFAIFSIGIEVIKSIVHAIGLLFDGFNGGGGHTQKILQMTAAWGNWLVKLKETLVDGQGILTFFETLVHYIQNPKEAIADLKAALSDLWGYFKDGITGMGTNEGSGIYLWAMKLGTALRELGQWLSGGEVNFDAFSGAIQRITDRFGGLGDRVAGIKETLTTFPSWLQPVKDAFDEVWTYIKNWWKDLGKNMADAADTGDFSAVLDVVNVGLIAGIGAILAKFMSNGINLNFGQGLFDKVGTALDTMTSKMKVMQTDIKANVLLKIAGAIALITASVLVLSLIDSAALSKALAAMAVGFGQLLGTFAILTKLSSGPKGAASIAILAGALILLAGAALILSVAVAILAQLSWEELIKGLVGLAAIMGTMAAAVKLMEDGAGGMIRIGAAMILMGAGLLVIALAMKIFATMSWEDMAKGLVGVAGSITAIALAMKLMPKSLPVTAAGLVLIGGALLLISSAMKIFATMSWEDIGKGMVGVGGGLLLIAGAMQLMPGPQMLLTAAGLAIVAFSLGLIAGAMKVFASMSWNEIARGLVGMAGALAVLALAAYAMSGSALGAAAIGLMAISLGSLFTVIKSFASLKWQELAMGLGALVLSLALLGAAAYALLATGAVLAIAALGGALLLVGAGMALFGLGAQAIAKAFQIMAKAGKAGIAVVVELLQALIEILPKLGVALAKAALAFIDTFLEAAPVIIEQLGVILAKLLDTVIQLTPKIVKAAVTLVKSILVGFRELIPEFVSTGFAILMGFLHGIESNIGEIVTTVANIITGFLDALAVKVPEIIDSLYNLIWAIITGVIAKYVDIATFLLPKGMELLQGLLDGVTEKAPMVLDWFKALPGKVFEWVGDTISTLATRGKDFITGIYNGLVEKIGSVMTYVAAIPGNVFNWVGDTAKTLLERGVGLVAGLLLGLKQGLIDVMSWAFSLPGKFMGWLSDAGDWLYERGKQVIAGFVRGLEAKANDLKNTAVDISNKLLIPFRLFNGFGSPSKLYEKHGKWIVEGLVIGVDKTLPQVSNASDRMSKAIEAGFQPNVDEMAGKTTDALNHALNAMVEQIDGMGEFNPVITPVLDLTGVQKDAKSLSGILASSIGGASYGKATDISAAIEINRQGDAPEPQQARGDVTFEQNIYAPTALSTNDIYRRTRSQIAVAKQELNIR